jgi:thiol-disulfide isomerase/thioredoxin
MATTRSTWIRASLALLLTVAAGAAFIRPFSPVQDGRKAAARPPERVSPEGFVLVDARQLLDQVRRTRATGVVVNCWASWCGSCKEELPLLLRLRQTFGGAIDVILVSVDDADGRPAASTMLRGFGAPVPGHAVDEPLESFKAAMNPRWTGVIPATFLFDRTAKLRYFWAGTVYENEITPLLRRYLAGEHIDGESDFALAPGKVTR